MLQKGDNGEYNIIEQKWIKMSFEENFLGNSVTKKVVLKSLSINIFSNMKYSNSCLSPLKCMLCSLYEIKN